MKNCSSFIVLIASALFPALALACLSHERFDFCSGDKVMVQDPRYGLKSIKYGEVKALNLYTEHASVTVEGFNGLHSYPMWQMAQTHGCTHYVCVGDRINAKDPRPGYDALESGEVLAVNPYGGKVVVKLDRFKGNHLYLVEQIYIEIPCEDYDEDVRQKSAQDEYIYRY